MASTVQNALNAHCLFIWNFAKCNDIAMMHGYPQVRSKVVT